MSVRKVTAKKSVLSHCNRLRPAALTLCAALALAGCGGAPVTVLPDSGGDAGPSGSSGTSGAYGSPGSAWPGSSSPGSSNGTSASADPVHPAPTTTPGGIPIPPATARPPAAPVARPASKPALQTSKHFVRSGWASVSGWQADAVESAWTTFQDNCRSIMLRTGRPVSLAAPQTVDPYAWQQVCAAARDPSLRNPSPAQARAFLEKWLEPWTVRTPTGEAATGLATAYYEPLVRASRVRGGPYQWPLYAVPNDLLVLDMGSLYPELAGKRVRGKLDGKRVVPYDSRAELERAGREPAAIVWVSDPVDAFFLQVQGTGRASLDDGPGKGSVIRVAYAEHNGHPYVSIGRWLVDQGELTLDQASMQSIKAWAKSHPTRVKEMLNANPAVVFFREEPVVNVEEGPKGAFGMPLTAQRSIAVDPAIVPLGAPAFLSTTMPNSKVPLQKMVFAQDTGSAIKGPARADVFWGYGEEAGEQAGRMKQPSKMWVLWPKGEGAPAPAR